MVETGHRLTGAEERVMGFEPCLWFRVVDKIRVGSSRCQVGACLGEAVLKVSDTNQSEA